MKKSYFLLIALLFINALAHSQIRYLVGVLQGSQAGTTSLASGVVIVKYNMATKSLEHWGDYRGLVGDRTNQHIHTGAPGVAGPVTVPLTGTGTNEGTITGGKILTATEETNLLAGNMYTNLHSSTAGGGEIRAQLTLTTDGQTEFLNARLQGAQSTPPNGSLGTGWVNAVIDKATNMLYLTGSYAGLTNAANNAHIHLGAPNVSGSVIVPLKFTTNTTGVLDTAVVLTVATRDNILSGNTYVNLHSAPPYAAGEIRGQLTKLSQMWFFANSLQGSQEFPVNASTARGTVIVKYNAETNLLELNGDYQNLNAAISGSHIHGPAGPGANASVLFSLVNSGGTTGTLTGSFTLTEPQEADLLAGLLYTNVHSTGTYSGGEIRAQLLATSAGESQYFTPLLQVSQSVSANPITSEGSGRATVLLDKITRKVFVTGSFANLSSNITVTHIHGGAAGSSGGVVVGLLAAGTTTGTITGTDIVRATFADSMINGLAYINIHSVTYGGGEIRGQLGDLVLPLKLKYFNAFKDRNKIALIWESSEEVDLKQYEVEQQDPATKNWITKGIVNAKGIGGVAAKYRLDDTPLPGKDKFVIYRLKMVDKNGRITYSQAVRINYLQSKTELNILTNPIVKGIVRYNITGLATDTKAEISIVDFSGRVMYKAIESALTTNSIEVGRLSPGVYKLLVRVDGLVLQQSFLK